MNMEQYTVASPLSNHSMSTEAYKQKIKDKIDMQAVS